MTSFNISIQNMTCAGCAGRAERALNALGDTQAIVNLATHSARVDTSITPKEFQLALRAAGYPAKIDKVIIQIVDIQAGAQADALENARDSLEILSNKVKFSPSETWTFGVLFWRRFLRFRFLSLKWADTFIHQSMPSFIAGWGWTNGH